jgi:hypothetical protein
MRSLAKQNVSSASFPGEGQNVIGYRSVPGPSSPPGRLRGHGRHSRPGPGATAAMRCFRTADSGKDQKVPCMRTSL